MGKHAVTFILFSALVTSQQAFAQSGSRADDIRTTFIFHIANYMTLPAGIDNSRRLTFCFLEDAPYHYYQRVIDSNIKELRGLRVEAVKLASLDELTNAGCRLVFFGREQESDGLFAQLKQVNNNVMTIGETRNFVNRGGIVGLVELQSRIKILINREEYSRSSMRFSSQLLKHARFR